MHGHRIRATGRQRAWRASLTQDRRCAGRRSPQRALIGCGKSGTLSALFCNELLMRRAPLVALLIAALCCTAQPTDTPSPDQPPPSSSPSSPPISSASPLPSLSPSPAPSTATTPAPTTISPRPSPPPGSKVVIFVSGSIASTTGPASPSSTLPLDSTYHLISHSALSPAPRPRALRTSRFKSLLHRAAPLLRVVSS